MKPINEDEAEILIEEHLRERGWNITAIALTRKRWRDHLDGEEVVCKFDFLSDKFAAIQ